METLLIIILTLLVILGIILLIGIIRAFIKLFTTNKIKSLKDFFINILYLDIILNGIFLNNNEDWFNFDF